MEVHLGGRLKLAADLVRAESIGDLTRRLYAGIGEIFGTDSVGFDVLEPNTHRLRSTSAQGVSEFFLARYDQVGRDIDPVLNRALISKNIAYNLHMMSEAEWRSLRIYRDAFSLHRMTSLVYAPVIVDGKVIATFNLARGEGQAAFGTRELQEAGEVAGLLGAVISSLQRSESLAHELELFRSAFDLADEPSVISDMRRAVRYTNRAARRILDGQTDDAPSFDEAVIRFQNRDPATDTTEGLVQRTVPLDSCDAFLAFLRSAPYADALPEWLFEALTPRERDVVMLVSKGLRDAEIAQRLSLSVHTVKGYLREVLRKTGARSRVELARMAVDGRRSC